MNETKHLNAEQVEALRAEASGTGAPTRLRNRAMVESMLGAGLRVSEVVALRPSDIDWQAGTIRVNNGKGGRDRVIPVTGETLAHLSTWAEARKRLGYNGRQPFFVGIRTRGKQLSIRTVQGIIARLGEKAGLDRAISPRLLRHTYAINAVRQGIDVLTLQQNLGHAHISSTAACFAAAHNETAQNTRNAFRRCQMTMAEMLQKHPVLRAFVEAFDWDGDDE